MSSAAKKRKKKKKSQAPVALVYVVTVLVFMALISMLSLYLLKTYHIIGNDKEEEPVVTVQTFNDLFARINSKGELADMTLIRIDPTDNSILVVPMPGRMLNSANNMSMHDIYANSRMAGVKEAVEGTLGMKVDNYATLSNETFERVCDIYGGITYKAPEELYYLSKDNDENDISIEKGELAPLSGRQIRLLSQYPVYSNGKQGNNEFLGEAMESLVNSMFQQAYITQDNLDNIYNMITENSDTDLNIDDFKLQKSFIKEMLVSGITPAERMVPEGVWGDDEKTFIVNADFIQRLKEKAAETTPETVEGNAIETDAAPATLQRSQETPAEEQTIPEQDAVEQNAPEQNAAEQNTAE